MNNRDKVVNLLRKTIHNNKHFKRSCKEHRAWWKSQPIDQKILWIKDHVGAIFAIEEWMKEFDISMEELKEDKLKVG